MFVELIKQSEVVSKIFQNASEIKGLDLAFLCEHGSPEQLALTENLQPLVLTCDIAAWELLKSKGIKCDYFAGYSLGEYAAIYAAGCCSLREILGLKGILRLYITKKRSVRFDTTRKYKEL